MVGAYYNEFDKQKAAWLRELIKAGVIAPGDVDERSIKDISAADILGYTQCHFFAGIGVWSYALRRAGWPDDRPVWTGSCPCQGFSVAGKKKGFADERHLWPDWFRLIAQCRPSVVFGEQSASKDALAWIDLVYSDMEGSDYSVRALDICAPGFGAPHIRQRLYFAAESLADANEGRLHAQRPRLREEGTGQEANRPERCGAIALGDLAHTPSLGRIGRRPGEASDEPGAVERPDGLRATSGLELPDLRGRERRELPADGVQYDGHDAGRSQSEHGLVGTGKIGIPRHGRPGPTNGHWGPADWLRCTDGKWRPTESVDVAMADELAADLGYLRVAGRWTLSPLIQKGKARVNRLKGYGDAIVAECAAGLIEAYMEASR